MVLRLAFVAATFSFAGQMHKDIKHLFLEQIRLKLQLVDGEVNKSKVRAIMKHCVRMISEAINRSASRNIILKATKMVNLARHTQQIFSSSSSCDLRPHLLCFLSSLPGRSSPRVRITNHEPRRCPNLSFILRFGKRLIHIRNNNYIFLVIKL